MNESSIVRLQTSDWLQVVDGLVARMAEWNATANQLEESDSSDPESGVPENDNAEECREIASHYSDIVDEIRKQLESAGA